jgi:hypothetical protein
MSKLVRLTALIGVLVLASGAPAYARGGGGGGGGGHAGGGGGHFAGGGGGHFAGGGGSHFGGGHAFGGSHGGVGGHHGFSGHHFDGHHGFDGHHDRFRGGAFVGIGPYWDPYWGYWPYGPYAYEPSVPTVTAPPVYIEKPQAGYCPSGQANYPGVQSCAQPWVHVAPQAG